MVKFTVSWIVAAVSLVGLVAVGIAAFLLTTPRPDNVRECLTTRMYEVRLCPGENNYTKLSAISPHARNAVLVSEDSTFYSHKGFDWFELQQSFEKNWESGSYARGGSTITQQLAKNVYLSAEKSLFRKLREVIITIQIESMLSKDEIPEKYLNVVEFGPNLYGIGRASRHYFGKHPSSLTPAEGAFLAFLLPNPKNYAVSFRKKQLTPFARSQTRQIVKRLHRFKKISDGEQANALAQIDYMFGAPPAPPPETEAVLGSPDETPPVETGEGGEPIIEPSAEEAEVPDEG